MARDLSSIALIGSLVFVACDGGQTGELFTSLGGKGAIVPDAGYDSGKIGETDAGGQGNQPEAAAEGGFPYERFVEVKSDLQRESTPTVMEGEVAELSQNNATFAFELYRHLSAQYADQNLVFSPNSISIALAMSYAGAENETARQMAAALHFTLPKSQLFTAFNKIDLLLSASAQAVSADDTERVRFNLVNSIWAQKDTPVLPSYLDLLAVNFDAGIRLVDFIRGPERAREIINEWVFKQTENGFEESLPQGSIGGSTRMVLVNAMVFSARWFYRFEKPDVYNGDFHALSGQTVRVPTMLRRANIGFYQGDGYTAVELLYSGDTLSMVVFVPDAALWGTFESGLDAQRVQAAIAQLSRKEITLSMPTWKTNAPSISLKDVLGEMGMTDAFDVARADFSGINGGRDLSLSDIVHKVSLNVNETGTQAVGSSSQAFATGDIYVPKVDLYIDRPFIYLIRDIETDAILFLGRVVDPR